MPVKCRDGRLWRGRRSRRFRHCLARLGVGLSRSPCFTPAGFVAMKEAAYRGGPLLFVSRLSRLSLRSGRTGRTSRTSRANRSSGASRSLRAGHSGSSIFSGWAGWPRRSSRTLKASRKRNGGHKQNSQCRYSHFHPPQCWRRSSLAC
jgi:hypothetical protein